MQNLVEQVITAQIRQIPTEAEAKHRLARAQQYRRDDAAQGRIPGRVESGYDGCRTCGWFHLHGGSGP
jgi:hypothetical protein